MIYEELFAKARDSGRREWLIKKTEGEHEESRETLELVKVRLVKDRHYLMVRMEESRLWREGVRLIEMRSLEHWRLLSLLNLGWSGWRYGDGRGRFRDLILLYLEL